MCRPCWTTKRKSWLRDVPKMFTRCLKAVYVGNSVGRAQRASERSERSEQSDQDGLGELPSESCSKDAFRVREGRLRKAIQHAYARQTCLVWLARVPAKFHLQRASRSYVNTMLPKNAPGITFSTVLGLPGVASWHRFLTTTWKTSIQEHLGRAKLQPQTFRFFQNCCGSSLARPRRSSPDVFHVFRCDFQ